MPQITPYESMTEEQLIRAKDVYGDLLRKQISTKAEMDLFLSNKISLRELSQGIDFAGYVARPHYNIPRRKTVHRIMKRIDQYHASDIERMAKALPSYAGYLQHAKSYHVFEDMLRRLNTQDQCDQDECMTYLASPD